MKKLLLIGIVAAIVCTMTMGSAVIAAPAGKDIAANNNSQNLYLYPKTAPVDPAQAEWDTVWNGAWGKYNFKIKGQFISGVFNGHGLVAGTDYSLISYNDPWGTACVIIGSGVADVDGNVHIATGPVDLGEDLASPIYDWNGDGDGYKIWLVPTSDITDGQFNAWNPDIYLFENNRIGATATAP